MIPCVSPVLVEQVDSIADVYQKAQAEIVGVRSTKGAKWPRDINLVLLVGGNTLPDSASIRELVDDRYVCRKFVLCVNGRDIRNVLADLPFWPPGDLISAAPTGVRVGVQEVLRGYDPHLIANLASHSPGVERVFEKIREGQPFLYCSIEVKTGGIALFRQTSPAFMTLSLLLLVSKRLLKPR